MITILPIANGFYESDSLPISAQECVNWYPNIVQSPAMSQETLLGAPGSVLLATTGVIKQENRGSHTFDNKAYFINGDSLYRLNSDSTLDTLGGIEGAGRVSISDNGTQLLILVPNGKGYVFTTDPDTLTEITDLDFTANGNPQHVVFLDGYFVFTTDTKKFIVSALNDGLSYNALDFGSAESDPDEVVAPIVFRNQLFIGGTETLEAFQNIGGADFPFQRSGLFIDKGVKAPFSVVKTDNSFMFIGGGKNESPAIWAVQGNDAQKVSTTAIDSILQRFTDTEINDSFAWSYAQNGAYFVGFSLPTTTLVINTINGRWHERKSRIIDAKGEAQSIRSRVNSITSAYGYTLIADSIDGRIGYLDPDTYTEYGDPIIRIVATQPFQNNMQSFTVPMVELTVESGVGNTDVEVPRITMERSLDGHAYKDGRIRKLGKVGEYNKRAIWRRNGRVARFEIFRFTLSDAVKPVIIQLTADIV